MSGATGAFITAHVKNKFGRKSKVCKFTQFAHMPPRLKRIDWNGKVSYTYTGHVEDVEVAVGLGFRRKNRHMAETSDVLIAKKLIVHANNDTVAAEILMDCLGMVSK